MSIETSLSEATVSCAMRAHGSEDGDGRGRLTMTAGGIPRIVLSIALALLWALTAGCVRQDDASSKYVTSKGEEPNMSEEEVRVLADQCASGLQEGYKPIDLSLYPEPRVTFRAASRCWWVSYTRQPNRVPSDYFTIRVDDRTREVKFFGGM